MLFPAIITPFSDPYGFVIFLLAVTVLSLVYMSAYYFNLISKLKEGQYIEGDDDEYPEDEELSEEELKRARVEPVQRLIYLFGIIAAIAGYVMVRYAIHSLRVDPYGEWMGVFIPHETTSGLIADTILAICIPGIAWAWTRIMQVQLIEDIFERYSRMVAVIPWLSAFMVLGFMTCVWFFYSNFFPLWWYVFTFGLIYGFIYFAALKDFKRHIRLHITQTVEFEEHFSLKSISIIVGLILVIILAVINMITGGLPLSYIISLFIFIGIVSLFMTPGKLFRQLKLFPRYAAAPARLLNLLKFARRYLLTWILISGILGFILASGIIFDKGFHTPKTNLTECAMNLKHMGRAMEEYLKQNDYVPPSSREWADKTWHKNIKGCQMTFFPECPSGGFYSYCAWRDKSGRPVYEIYCCCAAHRRAGVDGAFPRYERFKGLTVYP